MIASKENQCCRNYTELKQSFIGYSFLLRMHEINPYFNTNTLLRGVTL
jgi:hypothetical protein